MTRTFDINVYWQSLTRDIRLQTPVYAIFPFPAIACASIFISTREHGITLPEGWHDLFDADGDDMLNIGGFIMRLYRERSKEDETTWVKLAIGGKRALRKWLEDRGFS
jgi:hypothetical protein